MKRFLSLLLVLVLIMTSVSSGVNFVYAEDSDSTDTTSTDSSSGTEDENMENTSDDSSAESTSDDEQKMEDVQTNDESDAAAEVESSVSEEDFDAQLTEVEEGLAALPDGLTEDQLTSEQQALLLKAYLLTKNRQLKRFDNFKDRLHALKRLLNSKDLKNLFRKLRSHHRKVERGVGRLVRMCSQDEDRKDCVRDAKERIRTAVKKEVKKIRERRMRRGESGSGN
ncbi:MAG: hypothetical protein Q8O95_03815 [bacterium]|nr:hypothetical protein [bacterium]